MKRKGWPGGKRNGKSGRSSGGASRRGDAFFGCWFSGLKSHGYHHMSLRDRNQARPQLRWSWDVVWGCEPMVAPSSQPWAGGRNPVGIREGTARRAVPFASAGWHARNKLLVWTAQRASPPSRARCGLGAGPAISKILFRMPPRYTKKPLQRAEAALNLDGEGLLLRFALFLDRGLGGGEAGHGDAVG
jgi:hypothetical protein